MSLPSEKSLIEKRDQTQRSKHIQNHLHLIIFAGFGKLEIVRAEGDLKKKKRNEHIWVSGGGSIEVPLPPKQTKNTKNVGKTMYYQKGNFRIFI